MQSGKAHMLGKKDVCLSIPLLSMRHIFPFSYSLRALMMNASFRGVDKLECLHGVKGCFAANIFFQESWQKFKP